MMRTSVSTTRPEPGLRRFPSGGGGARPFTIAPFPATLSNPYLRLFHEALRPHGIATRNDSIFSPSWVWKEATGLDALHFHWPEILWSGEREAVLRSIAKFFVVLAVARIRGLRVFWTVHNLDPHEPSRWVARVARSWLARSADLLVCHSEGTAGDVGERYAPRGKVVVMPHGNYDGAFDGVETSPEEARLRLGLNPARPVVACVGRLRHYKGIDEACEVARRLGGTASLLIAGPPHPGFDVGALAERVRDVPGAVLIPRALTDDEVVLAVRSADLILLPYRQITGSGALLTAWTLGRAAVATDLPFFKEMVGSADDAGWLYPSGDVDAFAEAIQAGLTVPASRRETAARSQARRYDWSRVVRPVVEVIEPWRGRCSVGRESGMWRAPR